MATANRIPMLSTAAKVWRTALTDLPVFARLAALPGLAMVVVKAAGPFLADMPPPPGAGEPVAPPDFPIGLLVVEIAVWLALVPVATAWHRYILLGNDPGNRVRYSWQGEERRYLMMVAVIWLVTNIPLAIVFAVLMQLVGSAPAQAAPGMGAAAAIIGLLAIAVYLIVSLRLAMALPAAALGETSSLHRAWQITAGNGPRLVGVAFLVLLPFALAVVLLLSLLGAGLAIDPDTGAYDRGVLAALGVVDALVTLLSIAILLTFLTGCYYDLTRNRPSVPEWPGG